MMRLVRAGDAVREDQLRVAVEEAVDGFAADLLEDLFAADLIGKIFKPVNRWRIGWPS